MKFHFILQKDDINSFSMLEYLCIKSWIFYHPSFSCTLYIECDINKIWIYRLLKEFKMNIVSIDEFLSNLPDDKRSNYLKSESLNLLKDLILFQEGGIFIPNNCLCLRCVDFLVTSDTSIYLITGQNPSGKGELTMASVGYNPSTPKTLLKELFNPCCSYRKLFFENDNVNLQESYSIYLPEIDYYPSFYDLDHIMTVKTNFTKLVRPLVDNLWDSVNNHRLISY